MGKNYRLKAEMGELGAYFGAQQPQILHIRVPNLPQFRFEWHPARERVYVIRVGTNPEHAEPIGTEVVKVKNQETAEGVVTIWCQGYGIGRFDNMFKAPGTNLSFE